MRRKDPYTASLHELVDQIYARWEGSMREFALTAGLGYQTVMRLNNYTTRFPRLMTVWKLARAVGMEVRLAAVEKLRAKKVG